MPVDGAQADLLGRALDQLARDDAAIVGAMACLGVECTLADVVAASAEPLERVGRAVWAALDLRLIEAVDEAGRRVAPVIDHTVRYRFSHDRVAEAATARSRATPCERCTAASGSTSPTGAPSGCSRRRATSRSAAWRPDGDAERFARIELRAADWPGCGRPTRSRSTATGRAWSCSASGAGPTTPR